MAVDEDTALLPGVVEINYQKSPKSYMGKFRWSWALHFGIPMCAFVFMVFTTVVPVLVVQRPGHSAVEGGSDVKSHVLIIVFGVDQLLCFHLVNKPDSHITPRERSTSA
ncbi:hypothetical protein Cni_G16086 [Canna indica]|uniref:Uncharacterized protein n=1 Tax=Canna indica TaxID=4628 RepID=A0AAQ3KKH4_9LILI|nr:hypothetical protein Cni_G16086 [Canna indica]